jgi:hypothetical protein
LRTVVSFSGAQGNLRDQSNKNGTRVSGGDKTQRTGLNLKSSFLLS